ncbi:phage holin family protein [Blastomonas sp.]|uniref:phage holin family protein n=1 Tax=Blastomonas sp. TaxID=1909299 RepID=UPI00263156F4|nr:phage holin family protein [Blastomonas sp.]MDM7955732.1 phage holin family protein [Blastomonas sp.]
MIEQPHDPAAPRTAAEPNIVDLVGRLTQQGAHLAKDQVSLMQAEVREATQDIKAAIGAFAGAAVIGVAGLGVLLMGIAYFVAQALGNLALGTTIVGVATLILAAILYAGAKNKVAAANLKPERTIDTIEDIPAAATGTMHTSGGRP